MKANELVVGKTYNTTGTYEGYIFTHVGDVASGSVEYIYVKGTSRSFNRGTIDGKFNPTFTDYREATYAEQAMLKASIQRKAFVEEAEALKLFPEKMEYVLI